jgi:hypothetical protein
MRLCILLLAMLCQWVPCLQLVVPQVLALSAATAPMNQAREQRLQRSLEQTRAKLQAFSSTATTHSNANANTNSHTILVVDGNNVRGIGGKFEWSPVEWMDRLEGFCQAYNIHHLVTVWDHGPCPIVTANNHHNHNHTSLCLFSGLSQRGDDVMVQEARHWRDAYTTTNNTDHDNDNDFHNLCFVTNDNGLQGRLRRLGSDDSRKRVLKTTNGPLILDATVILELVREMDNDTTNSNYNKDALHVFHSDGALYQSVQRAQENLQTFSFQKKLNLRREKTWQRCVLADAMVRGYIKHHDSETATMARPDDDDDHDGAPKDGTTKRYMETAKQRGFQTVEQLSSMEEPTSTANVAGSFRLDKKEKRMLKKYNKFIETKDRVRDIISSSSFIAESRGGNRA